MTFNNANQLQPWKDEKSLTSVSGQNVCAINCAGIHIENSFKKTSIAGMEILQNKRLLILQLLTLPANR